MRFFFLLFSLISFPLFSFCIPNWCKEGRWYLSNAGGAAFRIKEPLGNGTKSFRTGMSMQGAVGYAFSPCFRVDLSAAAHTTPLDEVSDTTLGNPLTAEETFIDVLVNGYWSPICYEGGWTPYIGAGIGFGETFYSVHTPMEPPPSSEHVRGHSLRFAYKLAAGIGYAINPQVQGSLEYNFVSLPRISYKGLQSRLRNNDVLFKLTYLLCEPREDLVCFSPFKPGSRLYFTSKMGSGWRRTESYGSGSKSYKSGPFFAGAIGTTFKSCLRGEFELGVHQNEFNELRLMPGERPSGDELIMTYMVNGYLHPFYFWCFNPYVGVGLGGAFISYAEHVNLPPNGSSPVFPTFSHPRFTSRKFAYQFMTGISTPLTRRLSIAAEYEYLRINKIRYVNFGPFIFADGRFDSLIIRLNYLLGGP